MYRQSNTVLLWILLRSYYISNESKFKKFPLFFEIFTKKTEKKTYGRMVLCKMGHIFKFKKLKRKVVALKYTYTIYHSIEINWNIFIVLKKKKIATNLKKKK